MYFVLRLVIGGVLSSLGRDLYVWVKGKVERTAAYHAVMAHIDLGLNTTGNLLRHFFSIKTTERF